MKARDAEIGGVFPVSASGVAGGVSWGTGFLGAAEQAPPCRHLQGLPLVVWFRVCGTRVYSLGKLCSGLCGAREPLGSEQWFLLQHSRLKPVTAAQGDEGLPCHPSTCVHVCGLRA